MWREVWRNRRHRSKIELALSGSTFVDRLIFARRRSPRRCGGDREGVVQPRVQDSHPRRRCHLAGGRGATREPIAGTLSSPCAQSAPGQGKLIISRFDWRCFFFSKYVPRFFSNETDLSICETRMKQIYEIDGRNYSIYIYVYEYINN